MNSQLDFEAAYAEFLGNITRVVKDILVQRVLSGNDLAKQTGIAQPTVSVLLSGGASNRSWRLEHIARVAYSQGIPLADIVAAAEKGEVISSDSMALMGTAPRSPERLARILKYPLMEGLDEKSADIYLTADMCRLVLPGIYARYTCGEMGDDELRSAVCLVRKKCKAPDKFWAVFKEECETDSKEL